MIKLIFVTNNMFDNEMKHNIGGIEHYIFSLINRLEKSLYDITVIDISKYCNLRVNKDGIFYLRLHVNDLTKIKKNVSLVQNIIKKEFSNDYIVIYSTDYLAMHNHIHPSICIQHGIAWDKPRAINFKSIVRTPLLALSKNLIISRNDYIVCVDYNFLNWLKACFCPEKNINKIIMIPNFSGFKRINRQMGTINIGFARRAETYRGSDLLTDSILELSKKSYFDSLKFTIAGEGSRLNFMKGKLSKFKNVIFTKYSSENSLLFHKDVDIAIVPTLYSEGTSLSLLEAMGCGCCCISSYVGGLSNILIDGYNGYIIKPEVEELVGKIEYLVNNKKEIQRVGENGYNVVKESFNEDKWFEQWENTIKKANLIVR